MKNNHSLGNCATTTAVDSKKSHEVSSNSANSNNNNNNNGHSPFNSIVTYVKLQTCPSNQVTIFYLIYILHIRIAIVGLDNTKTFPPSVITRNNKGNRYARRKNACGYINGLIRWIIDKIVRVCGQDFYCSKKEGIPHCITINCFYYSFGGGAKHNCWS